MTLIKYIMIISILMISGCKMGVRKNENIQQDVKNEISRAERFKLEKRMDGLRSQS